jgi:signal transduction histidine kinase
MNFYTFPSFFAAVAFLIIACFIYFKNKKNYIIEKYTFFLLTVSLWNIDVYGIRVAPNEEFAEIWGNIFRNGLFLVPVSFYHFVAAFLGIDKNKNQRTLLKVFYSLVLFFVIINWHPEFTGSPIRYKWGYQTPAGPLYKFFVLYFLFIVFGAIIILIKNYLHSDTYQKHRLKYFFLALIVSFILGSFNFLPMFGKEIYPIGTIAVSVGLFLATYSVAQHRLMDVSVFMAKAISYLISTAILAFPGFFLIIFLEKTFFKKEDTFFSLIIILIGLAAVLLFNRIKEKVDRATHQIIVRDKYYYHRILEDFSKRLITIMDLNHLLNALAETVEKSMGINNVCIYLFNQEKEVYRPALVRNSLIGEYVNKPIKADDPFIKFLQKKNDAILRVELDREERDPVAKEVQKLMAQMHAEVLLPLIYSERLIGFVGLGHKAGEEMYYREDLDLLVTLSNQLAIAIENATLYENLKKSQNILRRSDRLASLGTLIASLAHEIRNPLVSIKTFTQLLPERMDDEEFRDYFLKVAAGEIDRLTSLINELLGFAKPSEPNLKGEDINALIDRMGVLIANEAKKKNITLIKNYDPHLPSIMVDAEQLKQVLLNILLNAIQAIEKEGQIWIETRVVQITHEEKIEPYVQIEIRDTGVGIPPENIDHVFDPFFSTKPEGSGLGLAISHQIIHEHGGFIDVESEVGKGTSFRINLPLRDGGKSAF